MIIFRLDLYDPKSRTADLYMGYILLDVELKPKSITDKVWPKCWIRELCDHDDIAI